MAELIRVTVSDAQGSQQALQGKLQVLKSKIDALFIPVDQSADWWIGDTGTAFRDSFRQACEFFKLEIERKLDAHMTYMVNSALAQQEQDHALSGKVVRH